MHKSLKLYLLLITSILFANEGSISGKVQDVSDPLHGANVFLVGTSMGSTTDSLGKYLINGIPVGKYKLQVDYIGYEPASIDLYIAESDEDSEELSGSNFSAKLGLDDDDSSDIIKGNVLSNVDFILEASSLGLNEVIVSASRKKEKITEAPSVVSVVNQQTIRRRVGITDFNRLASNAKGVDVTYYGLQGAQINARGFDGAYSTRFRQFADGLYLGESVSGQVYSLISGPPKEAISRLEILFGPQAALYGPDASQGLLNIITKHPMIDETNEINFSISNLNDPRLGARFAKNFDKFSIDISGETKVASELPYGNKDDEIYWVVGDTLYLNEDLYDPLEMRKNQIKTNIYYRLNRQNEFSIFYNYVGGSGYAMGSLGPIYNRDLKRHQYGFSFNNNNHFFRATAINQVADAAFRVTLGLMQVIARNSDGTSLSWQDALDQYGDYGLGWWLKYNSDDYIVDYQYNNKLTDRLNFVSGFDYESKDPDTDRTTINDQGESPITGIVGGKDINEYRYGLYGQIDFLINNEYSINTSIRFDNHQYYGKSISPRASLVRKNFLNGSLKLIAGTGFKAPTLLERNVYAGQRNIANGQAGDPDPILGGIYPYDWTMDAVSMGSSDGFTVLDFKDMDGDGIYGETDSLITSKYIEPLQLEENQSFELAYTGLINSKNLFECNLYAGKYKNFKGPLTVFGATGPGWVYVVQAFPNPIPIDGIRQINYGDKLIDPDPVPPFTYALTYPTVPLDVSFFGFETGWRHLQDKYEIGMNLSYFNDDDLVDNRKKGERYLNYLYEGNLSDSIYIDYYDYVNIYSNTPNFKGSLSMTLFDSFIKGLTTMITIKGTSPYDFVSGYFEATEAGKGEEAQVGQSWFINPGQIGGEIYSDIDLVYELNSKINIGFSIKNIFETQAPTFPLSPKIPRYFLLETGYNF